MEQFERPWSVPVTVEDIPETGEHYELTADAATREAVARLAGLRTLDRFEAVFDLSRRGDGAAVRGEVRARVGQSCVVTLEPIDSDIHQTVELSFAPSAEVAGGAPISKHGRPTDEPPERLEGGTVDLGAIATEFLVLALDPYPRKPGAEFAIQSEAGEGDTPFKVLATLKKPS
jgi:uncharacterized metal-binding protein YceD (DUF177 family)